MDLLLPIIERLKASWFLRLGVLAVVTCLYGLTSLALMPVFGPDATLLSLLPVVISAWLFGVPGAGLYGVLVIGLNVMLLRMGPFRDVEFYLHEGGGALYITVFLVGLLAGGLTEFRRRIDRELVRRRAADAARLSTESRHQALLAAVPDLMFRIDQDGRLLDLNMPGELWKRLLPQAQAGRPIGEVLDDEQAGRLMLHVRRCLELNGATTIESVRYLDGQPLYLETRMTVSGPGEVLAIVRDVTQRKHTEIELHWQVGISAAMAQLSQALLGSASVEEVSSMVLDHARRLTGSAFGYVGYIDPLTGHLVSPKLSDDVLEQCRMEHKSSALEHFGGLWGWVLENQRPVIINDVAADPRSKGLPTGHISIQRFLSAPAKSGGRLIGQIALANAENDYTDRDFEVVARLADLYAVAIREHLRQEELRSSEEKYRTIFETTGAASVILDEDMTISLVNTQFERFSGYSKEELEGRQPWTIFVHPGDLERMKGYHRLRRQDPEAAPRNYEFRFKHRDGRVLDVLIIISLVPGTRRSVASIIDITQRKRDARIQSALYQISNAVHDCAGLDGLYRSIHTTLGELMPAENFFIALYDAASDRITFPYFVDQYDPPPAPKKPGRGLTEYLLRSEQPLMISWADYQAMAEREQIAMEGTRFTHWLGVPLQIGDTTIGAMVVQSYTERMTFGREELNVMTFVSHQVAMAIERKQVEQQLMYMSVHDPLTGLYNRGFFEAELDRLEYGRKFPVSLVMADMNGLKTINDHYGHAAGDDALRQAAQTLKSAFRSEDCVARIGGDEFAVLLPQVGAREAERLLARLRLRLDQVRPGTNGRRLSLALGLATAEAGVELSRALKEADARMYLEKEAAHREGAAVD